MKNSASKLSRRNFLLAVGTGGIAGAAAVASKYPPRVQPKKAEAVTGGKGYQLTEHVRKYYSTTKI